LLFSTENKLKGLRSFEDEGTVCGYADPSVRRIQSKNITYKTAPMVIDIDKYRLITAFNAMDGVLRIQIRAAILCTVWKLQQ
jgi:hypothetical protein